MTDYLLRYPVGELLQMLKKDVRMLKYIGIIFYTKKGVWISTQLMAVIKENLQLVFKKADQ